MTGGAGHQTIGDLFERDPTRPLEEVVKVEESRPSLVEVDEFVDTESARKILQKISELVKRRPHEGFRLLYIHATFGSGKSHLLKLIGYATDEIEGTKDLGKRLEDLYASFKGFRRCIQEADVDHIIPVFLNLLNRDAKREPPLPLLMYRALARQQGYPIDPPWLMEWSLQRDGHDGLWSRLGKAEFEGVNFKDVLRDKRALDNRRGQLRNWVASTVPKLKGAASAGLGTEEAVRKSIRDAEDNVSLADFDARSLVDRIKLATERTQEVRGGRTEFLFGLDEVALFIGESHERYQEFKNTIEAISDGPDAPVIGTGQWSIGAIHKDLEGEGDIPAVFSNEVGLEGADTEVIVRRRWLQKKPRGKSTVHKLLGSHSFPPLDTDPGIDVPLDGAIEAYPFRPYDLWLLRRIMQGLITRGRPTEREHIQGRALLVLVRGLFVRKNWKNP